MFKNQLQPKLVYDKIYNFMKEHMKFDNTNSILDNPFFRINCNKTIDDLFSEETNISSEYMQFLNKKSNDNYIFPLVFKLMYYIQNNCETQSSIIDKNGEQSLTFFSLEDLKKNYDYYNHFLIVGIRYDGMGYVNCLCLDKHTGNFFFILDGGSSGLDRDYNYKKNKILNPSEHENLNKFRFYQIINQLIGENSYDFISQNRYKKNYN